MVTSETSSVVFLDEYDAVDTDVILVLVPSMPLKSLAKGNVAIVDWVEYNDLVLVLFSETGVIFDAELEVIVGVVVLLCVTEE